MNRLFEAVNMELIIAIASYAGELAVRVIPTLAAAIYLAELARLWLGEEKLRLLLVGRHSWTGRLRAAVLGAVLPFCECGAFPVMLGLIRAGVPSGAVLTFFLVSPVVSMPAFMILIAVFGLPLAVAYLLITVSAAITAGVLLEQAGRRWGMLKDNIAVDSRQDSLSLQTACGSSCSESTCVIEHCGSGVAYAFEKRTHDHFRKAALSAFSHTRSLLKRVLPYTAAVIVVSALLRNLVPPRLIENALVSRAPFDVFIGALAGIPIYTGDCAMIALAAPLIGATGAVAAGIAFIISGSGTSISGIIFMSSVFRRSFLVLYIFTVFCIALAVGYIIAALLSLGLI